MTEIDQIIDQYTHYLIVEKGLAQKTLAAYGADLQRFMRFLRDMDSPDPRTSDTAVFLRYLIHLRKAGLSPRSRARHLVSIRGFYRFLHEEGLIDSDPSRLVELPKSGLYLPDVISVDNVRRLLEAPNPKTPIGLRNSAMLETLYAAGLRVSELVSLTLGSINIDAGYVRVVGKGKKERMVPMGQPACQKLQLYLDTSRPVLLKGSPSSTLFVARAGRPMTRQGFWKLIKKYAAASGITERVTPIPSATPLPAIFSKEEQTCGPFKSCLAIQTLRPLRSIPMSPGNGFGIFTAVSTPEGEPN